MLFPWVSLMISILLSGKLDGFSAGFAMVDLVEDAALAKTWVVG